jgi:hypothetical protein
MSVLSQATRIVRDKWRDTGKPWKVLLFTLIVLAACIGLVYFAFWILGKIVGSLGGVKVSNKEFYFPRMRG